MPRAPVPFSTHDGSLIGPVDGANRQFEFNPHPKLLLHQVKDVSGHLLFRNGLLIDEYADYATGPGWFKVTSVLEGDDATPLPVTGDVLTGRIFQGLRTAPTKMRLGGIDDGLTATGDRSLRLSPQRDPTHTVVPEGASTGGDPSAVIVGVPYSHTFSGSPPFTVADGSLPPGLTLDPATGILSGIPTTTGTFSFTVEATDPEPVIATTPVTVPPAYFGWDLGNTPDGEFGFEYNGAQYLFLNQGGAGPLSFPRLPGFAKIAIALRSTDGLTWTELDSAHAPDRLPSTAGGFCDFTAARDGDTVLILEAEPLRADSSSHSVCINALIQTASFDLAAGTWNAPRFYYAKRSSYEWQAAYSYRFNRTVLDPAGHTQIVVTQGTSGGTIPTFNDTGGNTVDGTVHWLDLGVTGGAIPWIANYDFSTEQAAIGNAIVDSGGHLQAVTAATLTGGTFNSGATEPAWNHSGGTTIDNALTWLDLGIAVPGPALDCLRAAWQYLQLLVRGPGDYVLFYSSTRVTDAFGGLNWRMGCATFDETTFGSDVALPGQAGQAYDFLPLSACVDSAKITHFIYSTENNPDGNGIVHVGMDADESFGTAAPASTDALNVSSTSGTSSRLIPIPGSPERVAFLCQTDDGSGTKILRMFAAAAALNPVWSDSEITDDQSLLIYPDNTDLIPQSVALGYANGKLVCVWAVSDDNNDGGIFRWYWSQSDAATLAWSTPAVLSSQPDFTGEGFGPDHAAATQVFAHTMTPGIGVLTVWAGDEDDVVAQFSAVPVPVSIIPYSVVVASAQAAIPFILFRNGQALTEGIDYSVNGAWIWMVPNHAILPDDSFVVVISMGGETVTSGNGTITGVLDGSNNVFTLPFASSRTMLFRNGLLLTDGLDYAQNGVTVMLSPAQTPQLTDVLTAHPWRTGGPVQVTTFDDTLDYAVASLVMPFRNGLQMSVLDVIGDGNTVTFRPGEVLLTDDTVTALAWTPNVFDPDMPPLNLPTRFGSDDGSIIGVLDGVNGLFTLRTSGLITQVMVFWNGDMQTEGPDYAWRCRQVDSAGAWATIIEMRNDQIPNQTDLLVAQAFMQ